MAQNLRNAILIALAIGVKISLVPSQQFHVAAFCSTTSGTNARGQKGIGLAESPMRRRTCYQRCSLFVKGEDHFDAKDETAQNHHVNSVIASADGNKRRLLISMLFSTVAINHNPANANAANEQSQLTKSAPTVTTATHAIVENVKSIKEINYPQLLDYYNPSSLPNWHGTSLPGPLSLSDTFIRLTKQPNRQNEPTLPMGKWPDPILRHKSSPVPLSVFRNNQQLEQLQLIAKALRNTARLEGAVGLAAQQCGVDVSLIFIDGAKKKNNAGGISHVFDNLVGIGGNRSRKSSSNEISGEGKYTQNDSGKEDGIFLVNPRIIHRSPESDMLVWTEECLVLPPEFRATLLRDAEVTIEYESLEMLEKAGEPGRSCGVTKQIMLKGELARCAQHEMDHDRGILITDHVSIDELLSVGSDDFMAKIENADGLREERMQRAYSRLIRDSTLTIDVRSVSSVLEDENTVYSRPDVSHPPWFVSSAHALDKSEMTAVGKIQSNTQASSDKMATSPTSTSTDCDDVCLNERKQRIAQRRAMMNQSRSNTKRSDVLELSKQRSSLYGTEFKGLSPKYCSGETGGFCP